MNACADARRNAEGLPEEEEKKQLRRRSSTTADTGWSQKDQTGGEKAV